MKENLELLARSPLFSGMEEGDISSMLGCLGAREMKLTRSDGVFWEGDPAQSVGLVLSGMIQVVRDDFYGNRSIIAAMEPGELFGEMFACADVEVLPVSAIAVQESRVLLLDCRKILTVCSNACSFHNRLIRNLLRAVAEKNILLSQKIRIMSQPNTREKLMAYLLDQAKKRGSEEFTIPYDRQSLADYLGVERSAMSAEISKLKKAGRIDSKGSWFRILAP